MAQGSTVNADQERLYVCHEYGLFFLTAQPDSYFSIRPFRDFNSTQMKRLLTAATVWKQDESKIEIYPDGIKKALVLRDMSTPRRNATIPYRTLDPEVQKRLCSDFSAADDKHPAAWRKYAGPLREVYVVPDNITSPKPMVLQRACNSAKVKKL